MDPVAGHEVGLIGDFFSSDGTISDLRLQKIYVKGANNSQVGGIAAVGRGIVFNDSVEGTISTGKNTSGGGSGAIVGGLVGLINSGGIENSFSKGKVKGGENAIVGGMAGEVSVDGIYTGSVSVSYSTASVSLDSGTCNRCSIGNAQNSAGGLVGVNNGLVTESYATGSVTGGSSANLGGLVGLNIKVTAESGINVSYSTGAVTGGSGSSIGGAIGYDQASGDLADVYWNTTSSGVANSNQGAGNIPNDSGITGLTTTQLQSGLPGGFSSETWGENANINGGLPYLLGVPTKK